MDSPRTKQRKDNFSKHSETVHGKWQKSILIGSIKEDLIIVAYILHDRYNRNSSIGKIVTQNALEDRGAVMCWTAQWNEGKNGYHVRVPLHETFGISSRRPHENMRNCKTHVQRVCIYCERAKSVSVLSVWVYRVIELSVRTWSCRACALIVFANFITLLILFTLCYSNKSSTLLLLFV